VTRGGGHGPKFCDSCLRQKVTGERRFRCVSCRALVCRDCCTRLNTGQGGGTRLAECFECERLRQEAAA
jgi:hypothetical protein